jgi:hypothetical protein
VNKQKAMAIAKWAWMVIVVIGLVYYFIRNGQNLLEYLHAISPIKILLSFGLLLIGKLILAELSKRSINSIKWVPTYRKMLYLYSTVQLSKYLPGGIWHFVGRFGLYKYYGLDNRESSVFMIVENIWIVISAFFFGVIFILFNPKILNLIGLPSDSLTVNLVIVSCLILWVLANILTDRYLHSGKIDVIRSLSNLLIQGAVWFFIGLSFFVLLPSQYWNLKVFNASLGSFSLGWSLGYVTIFAPSGIGIREGFIAAAMSSFMRPEEALIYATLSRLVWIITEVSLGIFVELMYGSGKIQNLFKSNQQ